jgi:uncharacterized protein
MGALPGATCPICRREAQRRPENAAFPFCSPQCKLVDLGRWLDGAYRVPGPPVESTFDAEAIEAMAARGAGPDNNTDEEDE